MLSFASSFERVLEEKTGKSDKVLGAAAVGEVKRCGASEAAVQWKGTAVKKCIRWTGGSIRDCC